MFFPLDVNVLTGVPINYHPGAFGFKRRKNYHTGIDLYVEGNNRVWPCEPGVVVKVGQFTGGAESPWWTDTWAIAIRGESGVINYGEIYEPDLKVGDRVNISDPIGVVKNVVRPERARPDIPGHSIYMLHLELYSDLDEKEDWAHWHHMDYNIPRPKNLLDPLPMLLKCDNFPFHKFVSWFNPNEIEVG